MHDYNPQASQSFLLPKDEKMHACSPYIRHMLNMGPPIREVALPAPAPRYPVALRRSRGSFLSILFRWAK